LVAERARKQIDQDVRSARALVAPAPRRLLFVSHANPEDNALAKWLATQLAIAGYEVWCDVTELLGGERFWADIEEAIDTYAVRVVFLSTEDSNRKVGTLRELKLAHAAQQKHGLKDFVIPIKADGLAFEKAHESLYGINIVRFDESWASGLSQLLALLEREGVPKSPAAGPDCVTEWYRRSLDDRRRIVVSNDRCLSNWFDLGLPNLLHFHRFAGPPEQLVQIAKSFVCPARVHGSYLATFATLSEARQKLGGASAFPDSMALATASFIQDGSDLLGISWFDAVNMASDLVRQAWEAWMSARGLGVHLLASAPPAWFFKHNQLPKNKAHFVASGGKRTYRQLVGSKSKRTREGARVPDGHWHYAVSGKVLLRPFPRLVLRHHVIFTDDGETPWASATRMQRARRGVCKNWWNATWRDRLVAFCTAIAGDREELELAVSDGDAVRLATAPMRFTSPWTYLEDGQTEVDENAEIELIEEPDGSEEIGEDGDSDEGEE
jgi:hypothetical protein